MQTNNIKALLKNNINILVGIMDRIYYSEETPIEDCKSLRKAASDYAGVADELVKSVDSVLKRYDNEDKLKKPVLLKNVNQPVLSEDEPYEDVVDNSETIFKMCSTKLVRQETMHCANVLSTDYLVQQQDALKALEAMRIPNGFTEVTKSELAKMFTPCNVMPPPQRDIPAVLRFRMVEEDREAFEKMKLKDAEDS